MRTPDPTNERDVPRSLPLLVAALYDEDDQLRDRGTLPALWVAAAHRRRCKAKPRRSKYPDGQLVPTVGRGVHAERRPCCGKTAAIQLLAGLSSNAPQVKDLRAAVHAAAPSAKAFAQQLAPPARALLAAIDAERQRLTSGSDEVPPPEATADDLREQVVALLAGLEGFGALLPALQANLDERLSYDAFHTTVTRPGRPTNDVVRAVARLLHETGHSSGQIATLLGWGDQQGAAARVREYLKKTRVRRK